MRFKRILTLVLAFSAVGVVAQAAFDPAETIAVVSREEGSGTRGAFIELTGVMRKNEAGQEVDHTYAEADFVNGTSLVMTTVAGNEAAIGYASLSSVIHDPSVKAVRINGVEATTANILGGVYPIARPFNVVTRGELTDPLAIDFLAFILSLEGQAVVTEDGLVSVATYATSAYVPAGLSGKLSVGGSTSVAPVMELLAEAYTALNPNVQIDVQATGSTAGVTGALDGTYGIGMASRSLKASEKDAGALGLAIGIDGIAVIVNPENPLEELSLEQVRKIFTGEVTTWDQLAE